MAKRTKKDIEVKSQERSRSTRDPKLAADEKIMREAKERFKRCEDWESNFRRNYLNDVKFANGDSDNGWQWDDRIRTSRELSQRPTLTINKVARNVLQIVNDCRENKPSIVVKPTGEKVSYKAAQIFEGLVRNIERESRAQTIYDNATESQVEGGIGYWRVTTEYEDDDSFNQVLRIAPIRDQLSVYIDPDIKQQDGADAYFGFIFDQIPKSDYDREYPDDKYAACETSGLGEDYNWVRRDNVRIAEYYRILKIKDELIYIEDADGNTETVLLSEIPKKHRDKLDDPDLTIKRRPVMIKKLQWFKIAGNKIIDRREEMPGRYIPIVRIIAREKIIDGQLERKGIVRPLKDAQRMYNYNASAAIEFGALQSKTPYVGPAEAFEADEASWANANVTNKAYLAFKHIDDAGNPIPAPQRQAAPEAPQIYVQGMAIASEQIESASGIYPAQLGKASNEISGKAISERQRQSDTANYNIVDGQAVGIRHTGNILIDLIPYYYDTDRVIQILGKDGTQTKVMIDPEMKEAYKEIEKVKDEIKVAFNPKIGKYLVESDIGPAYSTQRQEAWNAFVQIMTQAPAMIDIIGDLMFLSADFPNADKIAERLRRQIEAKAPFLLDPDAKNPQISLLEATIVEREKEVQELIVKLTEKNLQLKGREAKREVDVYKAQTERLTAASNAQPELAAMGDVGILKPLILQTIIESMKHTLDAVIAAGRPDLEAEAAGGIGQSEITQGDLAAQNAGADAMAERGLADSAMQMGDVG